MAMLGAALIPVARASDLENEARKASAAKQTTPLISGLAAHMRKRWDLMREYKKEEIEPRLLETQRARRMEYSPQKLAEIKEQGGSEIFMGVVSTKCRTATAWLRDTLQGTGADKPWSVSATPVPDVPPDMLEGLKHLMQQQLMAHYAQGGEQLSPADLKHLAAGMKDTAMRTMRHEAEKRVDRMEMKMEDQLVEGGFDKAIFSFSDDIATYPYAVLKGPTPKKRTVLKWNQGGLSPVEELRDEWERVDPFKFYWAPWGDDVNKIPIIELHHLCREDVEAMLNIDGVDGGYDEDSVRAVLADFDNIGLSWVDVNLEDFGSGIDDDDLMPGDLVAALQLWDSIPGSMLLEWGMDPADIDDPQKSYWCEVWMIDNRVIKATLNYDPIGRKPYYVTSFEKSPGRLDGNGVADLCMDAQNMCNAAARSLANNMGISSGPQVGVNVSRLPAGEDITSMFPWKIWQFKQPEYGDTTPPMTFFQPESNAVELMGVFDKFMNLADEVTGIPKYMTGQHVPGAGRTSSGLSMLISNAGKSIKQVISNIDNDVIKPMLHRQYQRNLRYSKDPDLIGDVQIVARGAMSLVVKEAEAVRKTEFLRLVLESPTAQQIVGLPGTAELMRDLAGNLNSNVDRLVPTREDMQQKELAAQQAQQQMMAMQQQLALAQQGQQGPRQGANLQADGSQQGGRQNNYMSSRPNGA